MTATALRLALSLMNTHTFSALLPLSMPTSSRSSSLSVEGHSSSPRMRSSGPARSMGSSTENRTIFTSLSATLVRPLDRASTLSTATHSPSVFTLFSTLVTVVLASPLHHSPWQTSIIDWDGPKRAASLRFRDSLRPEGSKNIVFLYFFFC